METYVLKLSLKIVVFYDMKKQDSKHEPVPFL